MRKAAFDRVTGRRRVLVVAGLVALLAAAGPAAAQDHRFAAAWNAGGAWFSPLNTNAASVEGVSPADIQLDPGWVVGLQFEQWLGGGRTGWRINGAVSERPLSLPGGKRDTGIWFADFDLLLRLLAPEPDRRANASLSLGAGVVRYKLGKGDPRFFEAANAAYPGDDKARFVAAGGLNIDILTGLRWDGDPVGIRIEVVDHVMLTSPFDPITGADFGPVHNVRFVIGAFTGWGLLR